MASSTINLRALGLNFSPNALELPPGSMLEANNVIIRRDDVVESRRGYKQFGEPTTTSDPVKQLAIYRERILRHYSDKLAFQDGTLNDGTAKFTEFDGSFTEVQEGLRVKSIQSKNGNFYFTTNEGIKKISAASAGEFSSDAKYIRDSGGIKALDLDAKINTFFGDQTSFLAENSVVAYKLVWGKIDANNVEILGTPSERVVVYNPLKTLLKTDFLRLLAVLDSFSSTTSLIDDQDYSTELTITAETNVVDLRARMVSLAEKIDKDMVFANSSGTGATTNYQPMTMTGASVTSGVVSVTMTPYSKTFTVTAPPTTTIDSLAHGFNNDDLVVLTTTTTLPSPLSINTIYYVINASTDTFSLSSVLGGAAIELTSTGSGTHTINKLRYFSVGKKINLVDFKSNDILIDNLNENQTVSSVTATTIGFTARDYSAANSVGISGGIQSFTGTTTKVFTANSTATLTSTAHGFSNGDLVKFTSTGPDPDGGTTNLTKNNNYYIVGVTSSTPDTFQLSLTSGGAAITPITPGSGVHSVTLVSSLSKLVITTSGSHGLKDNQRINLSNTGNTTLDGNWVITTTGASSFTLNTAVTGPVVAGGVGTWNIVIDAPSSTTAIENNEYRSLQKPETIESEDSIGVIETRGTGAQVFSLQAYLNSIITLLKTENSNIISPTQSVISALSSFTTTTRATVTLEFTVPHNIDETYFYKLYRTETRQVNALEPTVLEDALPPIDYRLALQSYYFSSQKTANNTLLIEDTVPVQFLNKENLYTNFNTSTAEEARPNDYPPFAKDINTFKGYTFYANTKLKQLKSLELLGVAELKDELAAIPARIPKIFIFDGTAQNYCTVEFVRGVKQIATISVPSGTPIPSPGSPNTNYFDINTANNGTKYRFWFDLATNTPPADGGRTLVRIYVSSSQNTQDGVGRLIVSALNQFINDFNCTYDDSSNTVTITYQEDGSSNLITFGTDLSSFSSSIITAGVGESVSGKQAVISSNDLLLPASATKLATKSFIRVLNRNTADQVDDPSVGFDTYAYYSDLDQPGLFLLEGTRFIDDNFYLQTNNSAVGESFNPVISADFDISTVGAITTSGGNTIFDIGVSCPYAPASTVIISNTNTTPNIDGVYTITSVSGNTFTVSDAPATSGGTQFNCQIKQNSEHSDNYTKKNRIYYSKYEQPDAVPVNVVTGNYYDIGSEEKEIIRIFPLRDSLFIFKEDGLYRLSSEVEPFIVALFDSNCILADPDSVDALQNQVFCWTTQGISSVSESGVSIASRPIDTEILKLQSSNYPGFKTATFGVGYPSDNSYLVWTVSRLSDTYATQAFRYSSLTNTWTKYTKTNNCGVLSPVDDKIYLGVPDADYMEQERKSFNRTDYADYEYDFSLSGSFYEGDILKIPSVSNVSIGDVVIQNQPYSTYSFNSLLKKLDSDPGVADNTYYSTLKISGGADTRASVVALSQKLDSDSLGQSDFYTTIEQKSGTIADISFADSAVITTVGSHGLFSGRRVSLGGSLVTTPDITGEYTITVISPTQFSVPFKIKSFSSTGTWVTVENSFVDINACYNKIIQKLNTDTTVAYANYLQTTTTLQEAVIIDVDPIYNKITLNKTLDFVKGDITIYNAIPSSITYAPNSFGDPLSFKQISQATALFANKAFTSATLSFSSDLLPAFNDVEFTGDGGGLFGNDTFGGGFFGGASNSIPFRTYIPRNCQRCRYLLVKFKHQTAREQYAMYGITLVGRPFSTRAYR